MKDILLLLLALPLLTLQQCITPDDSKLATDPNARLALFKGQQQFALDMLQTVNDMTPTENVFFSPFSVYNALLITYFTAANKTEMSLKKCLHVPENQDKLSTMQAYRLEKYFQKMRSYNGSSGYELLSANRIYISSNETIRDCMKSLFDEEIAVTDFAKDPVAATKEVNRWVSEQTKDQIKNILNDGVLTENTKLVVANAAYFKGVWEKKFQTESTRKEVFYINNSQNAFVTMMRQKSTFNHMVSEKLGAHILELPYRGEDISMFILLPPFLSPNGVSNILKRLTPENFHEIVSGGAMINKLVDVSVPKFKIEQDLELTSILEAMGVGDLFTSESDLSSLTGKPGLSLDAAVHKAKITLDEEGTVAAAATALFNFRSSRPLDPAKFVCNHPFVYLIFDKVSNTVLFVGIFNKPPQNL